MIYNSNRRLYKRRQEALARLNSQLSKGVKTSKGLVGKTEPLSEQDKKRIGNEVTSLEAKL